MLADAVGARWEAPVLLCSWAPHSCLSSSVPLLDLDSVPKVK